MPPIVVTFLGFPLMLALLVGIHLFVRKLSRWPLGPVASYLTCALLFFVAILGLGREEQTLRATLSHSGAAYEAGMRDGDRVVAVNGTQPASWDEFRGMIENSGGAPIALDVSREGKTLRFDVQPRDGKIGVESIIERENAPLGLSALTAMASPVFTIFLWVRELSEPRTLMGPVGIIQRPWSPWPLLFRLAQLGSYAWPFSMLIVAFKRADRRRVRAA
jgi:membrane-associated protease RseP (regulator of RpoE activity)